MNIFVVGAGISGIIFAIECKRKHKDYQIFCIDKNKKPLKKIYATGNGKCNIGNTNLKENSYNCEYAKNAINSFCVDNYVKYFEKLGIGLVQDGDLLYPSNYSAETTIDVLLKECKKLGIRFLLEEELVSYDDRAIVTSKNIYFYDKLIFSVGGSSGKNFGTDGSVFNLLKSHGYKINALKSGLCPIKIKENVSSIAGLRFDAKVSVENYEEEGEILFKDDGLSGIVIFNISSILARKNFIDDSIKIDLMPLESEEELIQKFKNLNEAKNDFVLHFFNLRFGNYLLKRLNMFPKDYYSDEEIKEVARLVKNFLFTFYKNYDFEFGQVTVGGVDLSNVKNFASTIENNVYFIGEVLDVDGLCGGYNIMFAVTSALLLSDNL